MENENMFNLLKDAKSIVISIAIVAFVGVASTWYYLTDKEIESLKQSLLISQQNEAVLKDATLSQALTIASLEERYAILAEEKTKLDNRLLDIEDQKKINIDKLNSYHNRLKAASLAKPELIERKANRAIKGKLKDIADATTGK